jgi:hypothetical protein
MTTRVGVISFPSARAGYRIVTQVTFVKGRVGTVSKK